MNQFESNETKRNELVSCEGWKAINRMGALAEMHNILSRNYTDLTNHIKALSYTPPDRQEIIFGIGTQSGTVNKRLCLMIS